MRAWLRAGALLVGLSGAQPAWAGPREWEQVYDARLIEALDADPVTAAGYYRHLAEDLPSDDPRWGAPLVGLGRALMVAGRYEEAQPFLLEATRYPDAQAEAEGLLAQLRIVQLPALSLPWQLAPAQRGALVVLSGEGPGVGAEGEGTRWGRVIAPELPAVLGVGGLAGGAVEEISIQLQAKAMPSLVQVVMVDGFGASYVSKPPASIPVGEWVTLHWGPEELAALTGQPAPRLRMILLEDVTAYLSPSRGTDDLLVGGFSIR